MKKIILGLLVLAAVPAWAGESVGLEVNVYQGFRASTAVAAGPPLVVYVPPDPGWSADVARQRKQLVQNLGLEGAVVLAGKRAVVPYGSAERIEALQGRLVVSVRPRRSSAQGIELDVTIRGSQDPKAVLASASVAGPIGKTFILGGKNAPLWWGTGEAPVFVAVTPLEHLGDPDVWAVGGDVTEPKLIDRVKPTYPPDAKKAKREGVVVIEALVDAAGAVADAEVVHRAGEDLDQAALAAVRQWRYEPATRKGKPVPVRLTVTVNFTLG